MPIHSTMEIVDLKSVTPDELDGLWRYEADLWRERLLWDVSATFAVLRRLMARRSLPGKALRLNGRTVGYACYATARQLAVIPGLVVLPEVSHMRVGEFLVRQTIGAIRGGSVRRIESQFVSDKSPWLAPAFENEGFQTYWHECLRRDLRHSSPPVHKPPRVEFAPWQESYLDEVGAMLQAAYAGGIEAEIHERYRTIEGCREVLENIVSQGSCGSLVGEASALACYQGRAIGFVVVTETSPRQGHIPQVVVAPAYQGQGIGRMLLDYSLSRLGACHFDTLSLIVCSANQRALKLYYAKGFQAVLAFPVFVWDQ